ncbi:hypothetical protein [Ruania zhangjianzhongii]|uniref:hypothetical protein n=1 Tax=Ruania zhangjianzhongii TaxID=2603206 RepID=UPI0011CAE5AC|nr:hypothetical protein [Ruania zhangjianzhongii]
MRPDNGALAAHPEQFEFGQSTAKTLTFATVSAVLLIGAILVVLNFDAVQQVGADMRGRRARVLAPYFGYILIGLALVFGIWAALHATRTGTWKMRNGASLTQQSWVLAGDLNEAHQRLATADPRIYLPLPVSRQADAARRRLRVYTVDGAPATYLTLTAGVGRNEQHLPVIAFEGPAHEAFQQVKGRLRKPFTG